ncbi:unnamed protein product (macronuclear) [Paramecium tetraurelia]|uniref:Uncharacterized protein n=1 Tax=Paramecium tetraurelia TaxID=5888 RepID=A0BRR0_PARTE|nr:uncharacterized protein GSPATT00031458001 [Paramecium tetraurelia]CAK61227.1 unnamed protein product [Paramecium tetraurelia]|eukprot:XP_001428625.1 hypothetical protein (macronuclear) [Paramecium tetraurelia strain d4-2]
MMNYPNESQVNPQPQKSEILISYSRQQLKNMDFDPTKPENYYLNKKPQNISTNQPAQFSNMQINQVQGFPNPQYQFQGDAMKQDKTSQYNYPPVNKYQIQGEYNQNQSNLQKTNKIVFNKIESYDDFRSKQKETSNYNTYKQYQGEQK